MVAIVREDGSHFFCILSVYFIVFSVFQCSKRKNQRKSVFFSVAFLSSCLMFL